MRLPLLLCTVAALVLLPGPAGAAVREGPLPGGVALDIDGWRLSGRALHVLVRLSKQQQQTVDVADVVAGIVRDRVLGEQAARSPGDAVLFDAARVAFAPEATAKGSLVATLEQVYYEPLRAAWPVDPARFIVKRHPITAQRLGALLDAGPGLTLDDRLTETQRAALAGTPLLEFRFPRGSVQSITLQDVWKRLDVHGRQALRQGDTAFMQRQTIALMRQAFVLHWARSSGALNSIDLRQLQQLMLAHQRRLAWTRWQGGTADLHDPAHSVVAHEAGVSDEEIARYYAEHLEAFQRIERVHARHIRCADDPCVVAARGALAAGQPFADVARRLSSAPSAAAGGELGWIDAADAATDWLSQLALAQPPGQPGDPVRTPAPAGADAAWEILLVDKRSTGLHPADSETVRFIATRAIAARKAAEQADRSSTRWLEEAQVTVDPTAAQTRAADLKQRGL
jgi:hypothetical protein